MASEIPIWKSPDTLQCGVRVYHNRIEVYQQGIFDHHDKSTRQIFARDIADVQYDKKTWFSDGRLQVVLKDGQCILMPVDEGLAEAIASIIPV
jgi:hypothetical protein